MKWTYHTPNYHGLCNGFDLLFILFRSSAVLGNWTEFKIDFQEFIISCHRSVIISHGKPVVTDRYMFEGNLHRFSGTYRHQIQVVRIFGESQPLIYRKGPHILPWRYEPPNTDLACS